MNNMKRLLLGKGVVSKNLTDVPVSSGFGRYIMPTQQSTLSPTMLFPNPSRYLGCNNVERYTAQIEMKIDVISHHTLYLKSLIVY